VTSYARGIEVKGYSEGLHVNHVSVHHSLYGVQFSNEGPGTALTNCQLYAHWFGIEMVNSGDLAATNNSLYHELGANFYGIHIVNGARYRVIGNTVVSTSASTSNGIVVQGSTIDSVIQGNTTRGIHQRVHEVQQA
jgi:hypothetical protein